MHNKSLRVLLPREKHFIIRGMGGRSEQHGAFIPICVGVPNKRTVPLFCTCVIDY